MGVARALAASQPGGETGPLPVSGLGFSSAELGTKAPFGTLTGVSVHDKFIKNR